ncbi:MAG: lamin tail domain-containing protein [Turneriella sp.]|nr:lamin tail domain-containing protein [Turneriella sp.]
MLLLTGLAASHCKMNFNDPGLGDGSERFSVFFSEPGKDQDTMIDKKVDDELVRLIDGAERYMYLAVYNFNKDSVVQAVLRAYQRNIDVRVVGDIDEFYTSGYQAMYFNNINMTLGNANGIQHDKFAVVDDKYVFMGTGNISDTDMVRNNNNWYIIQNDTIVKLYKDEFLQMHNGLFASQKRQRNATTSVVMNNSVLELYFSPYQGDEAMDRIINLVESAETSIHYMIFAHTHDELDAAMVKMARQRGIPVYGIHDSTFVIGVSEEAPKMYSAGFNNDGSMSATGPFVRWDGNENTSVKNNPAHGGKMHCKTVLVDAGTPNARMATGSFNWSNNAINNNDENVIIVNQARVVNTIYEQWKGAWGIANDMALKVVNHGHTANTRDIVITEVGWAGASDGSAIDKTDDFIEVLNNSAQPIDMSHWAIQWGANDKRNLYPVPDNYNWYYENKQSCSGFSAYSTPKPNIICPGQVRLFYNKKPSAFADTGADEQITYDDQGGEIRNSSGGSLSTEHFKFSGTKNFKISNSQFKIRLYDKAMNLIDEAGDGFAAPAGLYDDFSATKKTQSMERRGCTASAWPPSSTTTYSCASAVAGNLTAAWFTHLTTPIVEPNSQAYTCTYRQDSNGSTSFDGCTTKATNTFSSAGYVYPTEANPQIRKVEAISTSQIRVTFDSNVSGSATNNCYGATGKISVANTQGACGAPTVTAITAGSDSSQVLVTVGTNLMTAPTCRYSVTANAACVDAGTRSASGSVLHVNGPAGGFATAILNEVRVAGSTSSGPFGAKDWAEIKITGVGTTRGLKLFYYNDEEMRLVYEFSDMYLVAGNIVSVGVAQAAASRPDRTSGTLAPTLAISLQDTAGFDGTDGTFILTYCATGENDTVDTTRAECNLPYKGIQDAVYYTDRDGSLTQQMVAGPLTHFYENLQSFWPISERPIYGLNDRTIQLTGICVASDFTAAENSAYLCSSSDGGISRAQADTGAVRNAGKSAWKHFAVSGLTSNAVNTGW